ncbi:MAG: outer membrane lipoprotein LolB [Gammaproteobacteria bacterium]|nr:outer membrane lipoprotein LolB [Gammaproteobacteria bacterium]
MRSSRAWAFGLAALAALGGCRTTPPAAPGPPWQMRRPQLQARAHFGLHGRVAVATGAQGFNARLRWVEDGAHAAVALEGPLGAGGLKIDATGDDLEIAMPSGAHLASDAARAELAARLGFDPPLTSLRYWILGVPDPASPADETLDPLQQRLTHLAQDGWRIDYAGYMAVGSEWLPARLTLSRADVRVKLLVDDWQS